MAKQLNVRVRGLDRSFSAELVATGASAKTSFDAASGGPGVHLLLAGEQDYHARLTAAGPAPAALVAALRRLVVVQFAGRKTSVRRTLTGLSGQEPKDSQKAAALDLTAGIFGAAPLFLRQGGTLAASAEGPTPRDESGLALVVAAARWVSMRRTTSFECLFPASPFHPEIAVRSEHLTAAQAEAMVDQLEAILDAAAPVSDLDAIDAAQIRSAVATVLSHVVATVRKDPSFRAVADRAAARLIRLVADEDGPGGRPDLRAHVINLLSMRGPALNKPDQARVQALLRGLRRAAPPYASLTGTWRFVLNAGGEFLGGQIKILERKFGFKKIDVPADAPASPNAWGGGYTVLKAPFTGPAGQEIQLFARSASPRDENHEMGLGYFTGLLISRHANLGAFDMKAALAPVQQDGYKLMFNCQCAGLTTRFAISRMFPDADIYSSWDSTYFTTGPDGETVTSEGIDCFLAVLKGMSAGEDFAAIDARVRKAQWHHEQSRVPEFVQFIGPAHPRVVARYEDINRDGKADYYDGFLDLRIVEIAEAVQDSATPRPPGVAASQIGGAAASGLNWAAGSLNRVTQYSELWDSLPGQSEGFYLFRSAGFYSPEHPPRDVPVGNGPEQDLGLAPAIVRYARDDAGNLSAEVLCHSWLSHSAQELKRLLVAAEAYWRAIDLGYLKSDELKTPAAQRAGLLLLLAGLLEFPADPNYLDGLWESALDMLQLPRLSRTVVRRCIDDTDHEHSNYYGSERGIAALLGTDKAPGAIKQASPVAHDELVSGANVGRARPLQLPVIPPPPAPPV